jgi:hypothetical protein
MLLIDHLPQEWSRALNVRPPAKCGEASKHKDGAVQEGERGKIKGGASNLGVVWSSEDEVDEERGRVRCGNEAGEKGPGGVWAEGETGKALRGSSNTPPPPHDKGRSWRGVGGLLSPAVAGTPSTVGHSVVGTPSAVGHSVVGTPSTVGHSVVRTPSTAGQAAVGTPYAASTPGYAQGTPYGGEGTPAWRTPPRKASPPSRPFTPGWGLSPGPPQDQTPSSGAHNLSWGLSPGLSQGAPSPPGANNSQSRASIGQAAHARPTTHATGYEDQLDHLSALVGGWGALDGGGSWGWTSEGTGGSMVPGAREVVGQVRYRAVVRLRTRDGGRRSIALTFMHKGWGSQAGSHGSHEPRTSPGIGIHAPVAASGERRGSKERAA